MPQPQQPQWQPITMLQTITRHIDGMLQEAKEVERLTGQMHKLHAAIADIRAMAAELSKGTIEKQMAKSDEQLGLEYLMSMFDGEEKQR